MSDQLEDIIKSFYAINSSQLTQLLQPISSDWSYMHNDKTQLGGSKSQHFVGNDHYWSKICKIRDDAGYHKFKHLASLANCFLSLSHGTSIQDETITA